MNPPIPARTERRWPDRLSLWIAAIAVLSFAFVLGHTLIFGVVLIVDSAHFVSAARSLLRGEGLLTIDGGHYSLWPPLYPLALAASSLGIFDPVSAAGPLNAVIAGLTAFVVGRYLQHRLESRFLAAWGCLAAALAVSSQPGDWSWALSEPLFILLTVLALIQTDRFLTDGKTRTLVWAAAFSALAWQTRYIGVAVPVAVGLMLLLAPPPPPGGDGEPANSIARRARWITVYALITAVPMLLWLLRNYLLIGAPTAHSPPHDYPVTAMLRDVAGILWDWAPANAAAALAPFACLFIAVQWKRLAVADWRPLWLFGGFALAYLVLLIAILSLVAGIALSNGLPGRLLLPLYIPLLLVGLFMLDRVLAHERERPLLGSVGRLPFIRTAMPDAKVSTLAAIVAAVLSLGTVSQANEHLFVKSGRYQNFNAPVWAESETMRYARENLRAARFYSNNAGAMALHVGRNQPHATYYYRLRFRLHILKQSKFMDNAYVVWFHEWGSYRRDYGEAALRQLPNMDLVAELADGVIFKVVQ